MSVLASQALEYAYLGSNIDPGKPVQNALIESFSGKVS
jgi:hypothetical protein